MGGTRSRPISEKEQDSPEIVETDELLDFHEFEDEKYLDESTALPENGPFTGESEE